MKRLSAILLALLLTACCHAAVADARADIVAELRDELLSAVEAREAELGRPLTVGEAEALRDYVTAG